jgi:hypothetical protein
MKRFFAFLMAIVAAMLLVSCGGVTNHGSSASAPVNVDVAAGDTSATVTWNMQSGVEYWIFVAEGIGVTPQNCVSMPLCRTIGVSGGATSPNVITGLADGVTYSVAIDGRTSGGPGGPGSTSIQVTPRLAGATWSVGNSVGGNDLRGLAYGGLFVAVGSNGALFSSIDAVSWTAVANPVPNANLNAAIYSAGKYLAVGSGGVILASPDGVIWTQQTSGTTNDLYAITANGAGGFVATGANGTIINSGDGMIWTTAASGTTTTLYGITHGNGMYVAVGALGTLLTSPDGNTWQVTFPLTSFDLKGVTYGPGVFVAIGDNGTLITSPDGVSWTPQNPISSTLLTAVTYGHAFIAVDNAGNIYNSVDGVTWTMAQTPLALTPLYAVLPAQYLAGQYLGEFVYSAVGATGTNMLAQ